MPSVDVVDLNNAEGRRSWSWPTRCSAPKSTKRCCTKRCGTIWPASAAATPRPRRAMKWPGRARSCGSRRAPAARAWVRSARRSGGMAARRTGRNRAITSYKLPRKMLLGALRSALSAKLRDGELRVVRGFNLADHKTKNMMQRAGQAGSQRRRFCWWRTARIRNLALRARKIEGREAGADQGSQRVRSAGASGCAAERERPRRNCRRRLSIMNVYDVIRRPLVTEKGDAKKEDERTLVSKCRGRQ